MNVRLRLQNTSLHQKGQCVASEKVRAGGRRGHFLPGWLVIGVQRWAACDVWGVSSSRVAVVVTGDTQARSLCEICKGAPIGPSECGVEPNLLDVGGSKQLPWAPPWVGEGQRETGFW